jgi:hypothetical protein
MDTDVLNEFPAQRFIRVIDVKEPRTTHIQYENQVYLKTDPIWALRINQDFHVPWGPWAWGCGHDVEDVDRAEAVSLGLLAANQRLQPNLKSFNSNLKASTRGLAPELLAKLKQVFGHQITIGQNSISWTSAAPGKQRRRRRQLLHTAVTQPQSTSGNKNPVSAALDIKAAGHLREVAKAAVAAIDQVHDDGSLPTIPLESGAGGNYGVFASRRFTNEPVRIGIAQGGPWPALTTVHEVGHFLDNSAIGGTGNFASRAKFPDMQAVIDAAEQTARIQELRDARSKSRSSRYREKLDYLLDPAEVWARAYAQYIAQASSNATLLNDLKNMRAAEPMKGWTDEDFKPIATAIETLFTKLGWL